ncbi:RadC family protein [Thermaerobacter subterraneus]|uniref:DNA replication and repair protein RadC n=1 Tax=Thermaerobacter subterraneus DSM 13965 TaxID=867903 RepID=K6Q1A0_9FIRM|nr:DNA repair protein RadC [Thermaerobacter subterraneus]EKP94923.1 DNA replication and repair protein RadC [Thermaerobacter subterraneus DSM 13965]
MRRVRRPESLRVKDLPPSDRPRERLLAGGAASLSTVDLLAILIGSGTGRGESALDLARRVLAWGSRGSTRRLQQDEPGRRDRRAGAAAATGSVAGCRAVADGPAAGGMAPAQPPEERAGAPEPGGEWDALQWLASARAEELRQIPGIGPARAAQIVAGVELGRRLATAWPVRPRVRGPEDVSRLLMAGMKDLDREHLYVVQLNTKHYVLGVDLISIGTLNGSLVHPREVFRAAVRRGAAALVLVHNHPSGDPTPSPEDVQVTRRLVEAGRIMGIDVLDHVIIGNQRYASLREAGLVGEA